MSNHQKEAKLKTSVGEFVGPLLKHLQIAKEQVPKNMKMKKIIDQISTEVVKTKDILDSRENWDKKIAGYFGNIEKQIDYWIDHNSIMTRQEIRTVRADLKNILSQISQNLREVSPEASTKPLEKSSYSPQKAIITEVRDSSNGNYQENEAIMDLEFMGLWEPEKLRCLYSLGIFPENTELKKTLVIYWWIGLGLVPNSPSGRITECGEIFFSDFVKKGFLIAVHREHNQEIDRCTIKPAIHKQLISVCKRYLDDGSNMEVLLNLNQRYLNSKDISSKHNLRVVQLGSWRYTDREIHTRVDETMSEEAKSEDHIEVDETNFLRKLGKKVTYLSLRGISGIVELRKSIGKLENLMILDIRACHNLEKLPQKSRSILKPKLIRWALFEERWFHKLIVLDISECYLLDHMPKWLCELSNLEVLKGFVLGSVESKKQSCKLGDLSKLNKLRKLSIRIAIDISGKQDFSALKTLDSVLVLTIIWGGNKSKKMIPIYSFPRNLEKLDIRCYPETKATELLNPAKLQKLKRLYIRGGKLTAIPPNDNWKVEILRLRFLENMETDWIVLRNSFENLKYMEYVECPRPKYFPKERSPWIKEKDEPLKQHC